MNIEKIKIGKNANDNWKILDEACPQHIFFHLSSFPSCYVIFECDDQPSDEIIEHCARTCKEHTKYRNLKNIKVDYTLCSNVTKGEKLGEVIYKSNKKVKKIIV